MIQEHRLEQYGDKILARVAQRCLRTVADRRRDTDEFDLFDAAAHTAAAVESCVMTNRTRGAVQGIAR